MLTLEIPSNNHYYAANNLEVFLSVLPALPRFTTQDFRKSKQDKMAVSILTAYDYWTASILEEAGIHAILVGDSVGNVIQGQPSTIPVTLNQMIYHTKAVRRGAPNTFTILDMPFGTVSNNTAASVRNCIRAFQESGAHALKIEGYFPDTINSCAESGIPVMGHLGFTPQMIQTFGSFRQQGKEHAEREVMLTAAEDLCENGIFALVLEMVTPETSTLITQTIPAVTIGIGAGPHTDGQILVTHDLWGILPKTPKFVRPLADLRTPMIEATQSFIKRTHEESGGKPLS